MPELPIHSSDSPPLAPEVLSSAPPDSSEGGRTATPSTPTGLAARLRQGFAWNLVAAVSNQGGTFVGNVIVARFLGAHDFGLFAMVQATLVPLGMVVHWATGATAAKYVAEYRTVDPDRAGRIIALCGRACLLASAVLGIVLVGTAYPLASAVLDAPQLTVCLMVGALYVLGTAYSGYQAGILNGLEEFPGLARAALCSGLVAVCGIALGAALLGVLGAVLALALAALVRLMVHQVWVRRALRHAGIGVVRQGALEEASVLWRFALPVAVALSFTLLTTWPANLFLVRQPDGYLQLALYSVGMNVRTLALFLPVVLNNVVLAALNHMKGGGQVAGYRRLARSNVLLTLLLGVGVAATLWSVGNQVLGLFGATFQLSTWLLAPFLLASICETTTVALSQPLQAQGRIWLLFLGIWAPRDSLFLVAAWFLAPLHGAQGLAWAFLMACGYALAGTAVLAWWPGHRAAQVFEQNG